ncbi:GSCOCG00007088001-RA-CDS, partial [Cotesia congregata]
ERAPLPPPSCADATPSRSLIRLRNLAESRWQPLPIILLYGRPLTFHVTQDKISTKGFVTTRKTALGLYCTKGGTIFLIMLTFFCTNSSRVSPLICRAPA